MAESTTRVKSISLIHQQLYQNENIATIEFSQFAKDLFLQVRSVFSKKAQDVVLKNNMPETILDIDTAVPLGLILNELMTNSYKYAFLTSNEGDITIALVQKEHHYELTYADSGPGLSEGFNTSSYKSLGMQLIRNLSKQIGGKSLYSDTDKTFTIMFKDEAERQLTD
jgi:two-component sensor histidine kinase